MSPEQEPPLDIPERYEDVTAEWLTRALRTGGVLNDQAVSSFQIEPISAFKSWTSSLARIFVEYEGTSGGLPHSMFAKFVSRIPSNRAFIAQFNLFRAEIALYQNLGAAIPLNMPRMYFGAAREESDVAVLILEVIDGVSKHDLPLEERQLTESEAKLALTEISKMHAKWWEDRALDGFTWLATMELGSRRFLYDAYSEAWKRLRDALKSALTPAEIRICDGLSGYQPTLMSELGRMPVTLCHGDFHVGNLLWDKAGGPGTFWVIDWQLPNRGPAVIDIAWFLGSAVARADVHLAQQEYLPEYHDALLGHGVAHYEYERFLSDYKYGALDGLTIMMAVLTNLDFARDDSVEWARLAVGNRAAAAVDAGCAELVS